MSGEDGGAGRAEERGGQRNGEDGGAERAGDWGGLEPLWGLPGGAWRETDAGVMRGRREGVPGRRGPGPRQRGQQRKAWVTKHCKPGGLKQQNFFS